jgi:hypothetical protein
VEDYQNRHHTRLYARFAAGVCDAACRRADVEVADTEVPLGCEIDSGRQAFAGIHARRSPGIRQKSDKGRIKVMRCTSFGSISNVRKDKNVPIEL